MPPPPPITLATPLTAVPRMGPKRAAALADLGVRSVGALLAYLPVRHERLAAETTIDQLAHDTIVTARGTITATRVAGPMGGRTRKARFEAVLVDDTGRLDLVWFNAPYMRDKIQPGVRLRVQGKAKRRGPGLQIANAKVEVLAPDGSATRLDTDDEKPGRAAAEEPAPRDERLRPVYPASEAITSAQIEGAIGLVLDAGLPLIEDHLPPAFRAKRELPELRAAYRMLHAPASDAEAAAGRRRLAYDELLLLQLALALKRAQRRADGASAPALRWSRAIDEHIRARFPFTLTKAQDEVIKEITADLTSAEPSSRLLQGDVGSGKTVVALYAMLTAVASRRQAALMAPTELLAEQHMASIGAMLASSGVSIALLTGSTAPAERGRILAGLADGSIDLVIGTHALLSQNVAFKSLAVAVIDEQHRFGVHQRAALREKGFASPETGAAPADAGARAPSPHVLVMTATPIPRTLALTLFGDLEVSTIRELPPGRKPIATRLVGPERLSEVYAFVRQRLDRGEQAYVVVPAIDGDETLFSETPDDAVSPAGPAPRLASVTEVRARLEAGPLAGKRLAVMHGRLSRDERDRVMTRLRAKEIDALVATTVIEVGVDVPNATIMVVENAERFGLAQLHQLRGRVGRGGASSACVLVSAATNDESRQRLEVMVATRDGFTLAEKDLELRGFGHIVGIKQSGMPPFRVVDLPRDLDLLTLARRDAGEWLERSPRLDQAEEALLARRLLKSHGKWLDIADAG